MTGQGGHTIPYAREMKKTMSETKDDRRIYLWAKLDFGTLVVGALVGYFWGDKIFGFVKSALSGVEN